MRTRKEIIKHIETTSYGLLTKSTTIKRGLDAYRARFDFTLADKFAQSVNLILDINGQLVSCRRVTKLHIAAWLNVYPGARYDKDGLSPYTSLDLGCVKFAHKGLTEQDISNESTWYRSSSGRPKDATLRLVWRDRPCATFRTFLERSPEEYLRRDTRHRLIFRGGGHWEELTKYTDGHEILQ